MNKLFFDIESRPSSQREITPEGYMKVPANVSRIGLQNYRAGELDGMENFHPDEVLSVFRPPEEVFHKDSLASFKDKDVTVEHPDDLVDSESYKACAVGHCISEGRRDGDFVVVDLLIKDQDAIDNIQQGKVNLSAGYQAEFEEKAGSYKGQPFSHVQKDIYINHIAVVDNPRAGDDAKIFDSGRSFMGFNFFKRNVSVIDEESANKMESAFNEIRQEVSTLKQEVQTLRDAQHVDYNTGDTLDIEQIVKSVKERISDSRLGVKKMIRDEIHAALKED